MKTDTESTATQRQLGVDAGCKWSESRAQIIYGTVGQTDWSKSKAIT